MKETNRELKQRGRELPVKKTGISAISMETRRTQLKFLNVDGGIFAVVQYFIYFSLNS